MGIVTCQLSPQSNFGSGHKVQMTMIILYRQTSIQSILDTSIWLISIWLISIPGINSSKILPEDSIELLST